MLKFFHENFTQSGGLFYITVQRDVKLHNLSGKIHCIQPRVWGIIGGKIHSIQPKGWGNH